jgi:hypothetical protein
MSTSFEAERKNFFKDFSVKGHVTVLFRDSIFSKEKKTLTLTDNRQEKITRKRKIKEGSSGAIKRDTLLTFSLRFFPKYFKLPSYGQEKGNNIGQLQ